MSFIDNYKQTVERQGLVADTAQYQAVCKLQKVYNAAVNNSPGKFSLFSVISELITRNRSHNHGCYLWGGVGRGKTFLMDLFFNSLPVESKCRFHFNHFMQQIHRALKEYRGKKDPLKLAARNMLENCKVICLDEFHVSDITDAMLLYGLLDEIYRCGAILIMTSNIPPEKLYENGLQRSRFMPAIELIKKYNHIVNIDGDVDYRLGRGVSNESYLAPLSPGIDKLLTQKFMQMAVGKVTDSSFITINNREIPVCKVADNIVWFDFEAICDGPRAVADYIELAKIYKVIFISNIYEMTEMHEDIAIRFIQLVDEFYDRDVHLVIGAARLPAYLYNGRRFSFEFKRTTSRLEEMRSRNYRDLEQYYTDSETGSENVVSNY